MNIRMRLFQRKGWFYVEFYRGKAKSLKTKDLDEAEKLYAEIRKEWLRGRIVHLDHGRRIGLNEFKKDYLEYRESEVSHKTYKADALALKLLADSIGGSTALRAINPKKIGKFKNDCRLRDCSEVSINTYLRHIKSALSTAEEWYPGYKRPRIRISQQRLKPRPLSLSEIKLLLKKADARLKPMIEFALWTGTRREEVLRVRWEHITWNRKPAVRIRGKGNRERTVPLLPKIARSLRARRQDIGPVFPSIHPDTLTHWFQDLAKKCKLQVRFHDLRHTTATYLLANGVDFKVVSRILGHASVATTEIYTEVLDEVVFREMRKLRFD